MNIIDLILNSPMISTEIPLSRLSGNGRFVLSRYFNFLLAIPQSRTIRSCLSGQRPNLPDAGCCHSPEYIVTIPAERYQHCRGVAGTHRLSQGEVWAARRRSEDEGLSQDEIAFYDALAESESAVDAMGAIPQGGDRPRTLDQPQEQCFCRLSHRENARARMRVLVKRILRKKIRSKRDSIESFFLVNCNDEILKERPVHVLKSRGQTNLSFEIRGKVSNSDVRFHCDRIGVQKRVDLPDGSIPRI